MAFCSGGILSFFAGINNQNILHFSQHGGSLQEPVSN
jgi:hypothetical protein